MKKLSWESWLAFAFFFATILRGERLKFMFSTKATKIDEIFAVDLTLCSKCQIDGLLRKHEL